jgi:Protein of unknown function (DUF3892)
MRPAVLTLWNEALGLGSVYIEAVSDLCFVAEGCTRGRYPDSVLRTGHYARNSLRILNAASTAIHRKIAASTGFETFSTRNDFRFSFAYAIIRSVGQSTSSRYSMGRFQVTCITKRGGHSNPHERIQHIGYQGSWKLSEDSAIRRIKDGSESFYTLVNGREADVVVASHNGREYLKTSADGYSPDNLLSLPECQNCEIKG